MERTVENKFWALTDEWVLSRWYIYNSARETVELRKHGIGVWGSYFAAIRKKETGTDETSTYFLLCPPASSVHTKRFSLVST